MFKFHQERLDDENLLGKGASGEVFPYQKDPQDLRWVVKRILAKNIDELINCLPEVVLGFACDHPCVVPVKGFFVEKVPNSKYFHVYMKIPRMTETLSTNFKDRKRRNNPFTEKEIIQHFYSLTCALKYLHSKKIYYRDIRPDNLLLDEKGNLKIADVGIAKHVEDEDLYQLLTGDKGTYNYSAPETQGEKITKENLPKADIWSLGVVILELCVFENRLLYSTLPEDKLQSKLNELFGSLEGKCQKELITLIQSLLNLNPKERPDLDQIKDELEKSFSESLNKNLFNFENSYSGKTNNQSEAQIAELNKYAKEIMEKYEAEIKDLKENIVQLKMELMQQKQQHEDRIKVLVGQSDSKAREEHPKADSEKIKELEQELDQLKSERQGHRETNEKVRSLEEQVQTLKQENTSYEQKSKDLQRYLDTSIKEQMKAYEDQIKALEESHLAEKTKLEEGLNASQLKVKEIESKRESFGEDFEGNLKKAVLKLQAKWNHLFKFEGKDRKLKISRNEFRGNPTDESVGGLSKDLIEILDEQHLFNLFGLEINLYSCGNLTDKALEHLSTALSNQALHLQHLTLHFYDCAQLTDQAIKYVTAALSTQALHLQHLTLNFGNCEKLTDKALEYVAAALSDQGLHLQYLTLEFAYIQKISDIGVEKLSVVIKDSCQNLQQLRLNFLSPWMTSSQVTTKKKESLRKIFAHIPKLTIK